MPVQALDGLLVLDFSTTAPAVTPPCSWVTSVRTSCASIRQPVCSRRSTLSTPAANRTERYAAHLVVDRNKQSITLDLKHPDGKAILRRLIERADILVEGFRPGVMRRLGADYDTVNEGNPRLIYCSLTGFGHDGPYRDLPAHDWNYTGMGGALSLIGPRGGPPFLPASLIADMAGAGLHGVIGILLALAARERTGRGQFVDVSYLDGVISHRPPSRRATSSPARCRAAARATAPAARRGRTSTAARTASTSPSAAPSRCSGRTCAARSAART